MNDAIRVQILDTGDAQLTFPEPPSVTVGKRERKELARGIVDIALQERQSDTFYGNGYFFTVADMPSFDGTRSLTIMCGEGDGMLWLPSWSHFAQLSIEEAFALAGALISNMVIV